MLKNRVCCCCGCFCCQDDNMLRIVLWCCSCHACCHRKHCTGCKHDHSQVQDKKVRNNALLDTIGCLSRFPANVQEASRSFQSQNVYFIQKHPFYSGNPNSETPGDSKNAFLYWGDVIDLSLIVCMDVFNYKCCWGGLCIYITGWIYTAATLKHCLEQHSFQQMLWPRTQSLTDFLSARGATAAIAIRSYCMVSNQCFQNVWRSCFWFCFICRL